MLTEQERNCLSEFILSLPMQVVFSLAKNFTDGIIKHKTKEDALRSILLHTTSFTTFLNKKKVTRASIFEFLHNKNISFPTKADKATLVEILVNFWKQGNIVSGSSSGYIQDELTGNTQQNADSLLQEMSIKFAEWFYNKMNVGSCNSAGNEGLSARDFWSDASVRLRVCNGNDDSLVEETSAEGDTECIRLVSDVCQRHQIYLVPNLDLNGTKGMCDAHGLVAIKSCGTLHTHDRRCVGIFQQVFGLIKDPLQPTNWKIKMTDLVMKSQPVLTPPTLPDENELQLRFD